jgi:hypothetical protein
MDSSSRSWRCRSDGLEIRRTPLFMYRRNSDLLRARQAIHKALGRCNCCADPRPRSSPGVSPPPALVWRVVRTPVGVDQTHAYLAPKTTSFKEAVTLGAELPTPGCSSPGTPIKPSGHAFSRVECGSLLTSNKDHLQFVTNRFNNGTDDNNTLVSVTADEHGGRGWSPLYDGAPCLIGVRTSNGQIGAL